MEQMIPWLVLCVLFLAFCLWKPRAARVFIGFFFIVMAVGVNWVLSLTAPDSFVDLGASEPLLDVYEWVFTEVVAHAPQAVGIVAGIGEIILGVLMLSKGRPATVGLVGAIAFLLLITPLGIWTLPNPIMALGLVYLLTRPLDRSFPEMIGSRTRRGGASRAKPVPPQSDRP